MNIFSTEFFSVFDNDQDLMIDYKELMTGISAVYRGSFSQKIRLIFRLFDYNEDWVVDKQEMSKMLTSIYTVCNYSDSETKMAKEVDFFVNTLIKDSKRPDVLTFDEFKEVILLQPCVVQCFNLESATVVRRNSIHIWTQ